MAILYRIFCFVPPTLLFVIPLFSQIEGRLERLPDGTYTVSAVPTVSWSPPQSITNSAQLTLRVRNGKFILSDFQNLLGTWSANNPITAPPEASAYDYYSFSLNTPLTQVVYESGVALPLFSFRNGGTCSSVEIIDADSDPFMPPNSANANIGNAFSILGAGIGQNAYSGNTAESSLNCPPPGLNISDDGIACAGEKTSIHVTVINGEPPYSLYWQNLATGDDGTVSVPDEGGTYDLPSVKAGQYLFEVRDQLDSLLQLSYTLNQPAPISLTLASFDASCDGSLDGVAFVKKATGGTAAADYQYYWSSNPSVSSPTAGFLDPGVYTVTVVDDNGCTTTGSVEVAQMTVIYLNQTVGGLSCYGDTDGVIDLYPIGVNPPFTYTWSANAQTGNFSSAWNLAAGAYSVTVTDATGVCQASLSFEIEEPLAIESDYLLTMPTCFGDNGFLTLLAVENAEAPYQVSVTEGRELSPLLEYEIAPGVLQTLRIEDAKGCVLEEEFLVPAPAEIQVSLQETMLLNYGQPITLNPEIYPSEGLSIQWSPPDGLSCDDCRTPELIPSLTSTIVLTVSDSNGCKKSFPLSLLVRKPRELYIPTAFSPNGDGINDTFCLHPGFGVTKVSYLRVFDRWGSLLFDQKGDFIPEQEYCGWDGTQRGKVMATGTYLYALAVEFIDGEEVIYAGEVNLMR